MLDSGVPTHFRSTEVVFSEVTARLAVEIGLTHTETRQARIRHVTSDSWLAVTSLLAGRCRLCTRQDEGEWCGTFSEVNETITTGRGSPKTFMKPFRKMCFAILINDKKN